MWEEKTIETKNATFRFWVKHFEEGSIFGINGGRISKLMIKKNNEITCNYERGWDIKPVDKETAKVFKEILKKYN